MGQFVNIKSLFIASLLTLVSLSSQAETRYISDDVTIFMHTGPSTKYRIIGTIKAGEAVKFLQTDPATKFAQIITSKNKTAWIDGRLLTRRASLKVRTPKLQAELARTKKALASINKTNADKVAELTSASRQAVVDKDILLVEKTNTIETLTAKNNMLTNEVEQLRAENVLLSTKMDTKQEDEQHRFFMLGALILGLGLIAGLIIPSIRFRKKKNDGWD